MVGVSVVESMCAFPVANYPSQHVIMYASIQSQSMTSSFASVVGSAAGSGAGHARAPSQGWIGESAACVASA